MSINFCVIKEDSFIKSVWSGGTTEQIYIYPHDAVYKNADFLFRISRASVDIKPSDFTKISGVKRFIMPLDSQLILTHDEKTDIKLKPFEVYEFSAEIDTISKSIAKDFNLMLANGAQGDMSSVYLEANYAFLYEDTQFTNKYFIGFYTPFEEVIININDQTIKLSEGSLFIAKSDDDAHLGYINITSKQSTHIIVIKVIIET